MDHTHYQGQKILKDIDKEFNSGSSANNFCHTLQILSVKQNLSPAVNNQDQAGWNPKQS